jgi:isocitrate/isopropylmalate dehydrogenase
MVARFAGVFGRRGSCHGKAIDCAGPEKQNPAARILVERLVALQCKHQRWAKSLYTFDGGRIGRRYRN